MNPLLINTVIPVVVRNGTTESTPAVPFWDLLTMVMASFARYEPVTVTGRHSTDSGSAEDVKTDAIGLTGAELFERTRELKA